MKATRLNGSATLYSVESKRLCCSRSECGYTTTSKKRHELDACPRCHKAWVNALGAGQKAAPTGILERRQYQVDIAEHGGIGRCCCENHQFNLEPKLSRMTALELSELPDSERELARCSHIVAARKAACEPENLDALLAALTQQEQGAGP